MWLGVTSKTIYAKIKEIGYTGSESLIKRTMHSRCNFNILKNKISMLEDLKFN